MSVLPECHLSCFFGRPKVSQDTKVLPSPKLKACLPQKMDGWKMSFLLRWPIYRGELAVRFIAAFHTFCSLEVEGLPTRGLKSPGRRDSDCFTMFHQCWSLSHVSCFIHNWMKEWQVYTVYLVRKYVSKECGGPEKTKQKWLFQNLSWTWWKMMEHDGTLALGFQFSHLKCGDSILSPG